MSVRKKSFLSLLLFLLVCALCILTIEFLSYKTLLLPGSEVVKVQSYLKFHPEVGYLWKENISYSDNVLLPWVDIITEPLSTDKTGFRNHPEAISFLRHNKHINIIGLGDSFMHDAAYLYFNLFSEKNLFYYNMAMHRHCPPQYNIILQEYVLPLKPDWIIYGVFENDFCETIDFENWKKSGTDWFTYHSGCWAGPATNGRYQYLKSFIQNYLKGSYVFYKIMQQKYWIWKERVFNKTEQKETVQRPFSHIEKVYSYILQAYGMAHANNIRLLVVLIPGKETTLTGKPNKDYNQLYELLQKSDIPVLDLQKKFNAMPDKQKLYYKIDSHWNFTGMREGAKAMLDFMEKYQ